MTSIYFVLLIWPALTFAGPDSPDAIEQALRTHPRTIFVAEHLAPDVTPSFLSSEHDWGKDAGGREPVDLVVGIANNNVYDLALTRDAKAMVIVDEAIEPLVVQSFLLEPFFRMAKSRRSFLGLLRGRWLPDSTAADSIVSLFEGVEALDAPYTSGFVDAAPLTRARAIAGPLAEGLVKAFYSMQVLFGRWDRGDNLAYQTVMSERYSMSLRHPSSHTAADMFTEFKNHYLAESEVTADYSERSFLASEGNYQKLRRYFVEGRVYFALSDVADPKLFVRVGELMRDKNWRRVAVSTSNIFDCFDVDAMTRELAYRRFTQRACDTLLEAGAAEPVYFQQTRGRKPPHRFEHHQIGKSTGHF